MVPTLPGRSEDYELCLALKPAHVLLLVGNGGSINQRDPGTRLAGHKTITMSARYSHLSPEHRLSVIDRIATVN
jgi:hypothetical protein